MSPTEFLINYFEIEPERYEQEGETCIAEMLYEEINDGEISKLIEVMEKYAHYKCVVQSEIEKFKIEQEQSNFDLSHLGNF